MGHSIKQIRASLFDAQAGAGSGWLLLIEGTDGEMYSIDWDDLPGIITETDPIYLAQKGQPNGCATLDGSGKVPAAQLPSFVDDVEEYPNFASFPATGETGKIYVALDTGKIYRWTGSMYLEISTTDIADDSVTNEKLANMPAWSLKARNQATTGDPEDVASGDITTDASPAAGKFLLGFDASGNLVKYDVGNLPAPAPSTVYIQGHNVADGGITVITAIAAKVPFKINTLNGYGIDGLTYTGSDFIITTDTAGNTVIRYLGPNGVNLRIKVHISGSAQGSAHVCEANLVKNVAGVPQFALMSRMRFTVYGSPETSPQLTGTFNNVQTNDEFTVVYANFTNTSNFILDSINFEINKQ